MSVDPAVARLSRRLPGRRAFITGAASGLGRALALELARDRWQLGLADLAGERLTEVCAELDAAGAQTTAFTGDVAAEDFVAAAIAGYAGSAGGLDLVINNAGVAVAGTVEATPAEDWRWALAVNLLGVVNGCRAAVPLMRAQASGVILNIASSAGFASAPQMGAYNASKAGVISVSETLAGELHRTGIQVSVAMPGFFRNGLLNSMRAPAEERATAARLMRASEHDATDAARWILARVAWGDLYIVWPGPYRWLWRLKRFFPLRFLSLVQRMHAARLAADPRRG